MPEYTEDEAKEFGKWFLDKYFALGFGVLSKRETEFLIFSKVSKFGSMKTLRNYELANELKITESRVKSLRLESAMRFSTPNHKAVLGNIVQRLIDQDMIPSLSSAKIELSLEDPIEKREYEYAVKLAKQHVEYGRNREIVITSPSQLLEVIVTNAEKGEQHFKVFVQAHIRDSKLQKKILKESLTLSQRVGLVIESLKSPSAVKGIFAAAKGWLSGGSA